MIIDRLLYDAEASTLTIESTDGYFFRVDNAGHAKRLAEKMRPGDKLTDEQEQWLVANGNRTKSAAKESRENLRKTLASLRQEIRTRNYAYPVKTETKNTRPF